MSIRTLIATYKSLRQTAAWRLLAADTAPETIALLEAMFDEVKELPASIFLERLINTYSAGSIEIISRDKALVIANQWVIDGYLVRRLVQGNEEETYALTAAGQEAIRTISRMKSKRRSPTESRLELMMHSIERLAADSDTSNESRIEQLEEEKRRIDEEIAAIRAGQNVAISRKTALERVNEILDLVADLEGDFQRVREEFERLNRELRTKILQSNGTRGEILDKFFLGFDGITQSEAGQAFSAFYRLLTDDKASEDLEEAIRHLNDREFYWDLTPDEQRRISSLQSTLVEKAESIHSVMLHLAKALKDFVCRRGFVEEQRLATLIREARQAALLLSKQKGLRDGIMEMTFPWAKINSVAQWELDDPEETSMEEVVVCAIPPAVNTQAIFERLQAVEIDFPSLMRTIEALLSLPGAPPRISIGGVYQRLPRQQGLGSLVGLLSLATKYGEPGREGMPCEWIPIPDVPPEETDMTTASLVIPEKTLAAQEKLTWYDRKKEERKGLVPLYWFTQQSVERMRASHQWR